MSAYKKLNRKDNYTSVYNSQKNWSVREDEFEDLGIKIYHSDNGIEYLKQSINHLYFSLFNSDKFSSTFYENYLQSSFDNQDNREYSEDDVTIFNFPSNIIGTHIVPNSLDIEFNPDLQTTPYFNTGYIDETLGLSPNNEYVVPNGYNQTFFFITDPNNPEIKIQTNHLYDDGEGNIVVRGSNGNSIQVGTIIYTHGILIIKNQIIQGDIKQQSKYRVKWKSNLPIYTKNYHCRVKNSELNFSFNKTLYDLQSGEINSNVLQKAFTPYITTIGLYNDANQLIAVAKTSQPIPKSKFTDTTFNIKLDMPFGVQGDLQPITKLQGYSGNEYMVEDYVDNYFI